jgi:hypothetical protein
VRSLREAIIRGSRHPGKSILVNKRRNFAPHRHIKDASNDDAVCSISEVGIDHTAQIGLGAGNSLVNAILTASCLNSSLCLIISSGSLCECLTLK